MSDIITPDQIKREQFQNELNALTVKYGVALVPVFNFDGKNLNVAIQIVDRAQTPAAATAMPVEGKVS